MRNRWPQAEGGVINTGSNPQLFEWAVSALTDNERRFLLSVKQGEPDWALLPFEGLDQWPAIQWKLHNIGRMSTRSHRKVVERLREVLGI